MVEAIQQDFYATMYLANMAAAARRTADAQVQKEREGKNNKYTYHINVNHEIGVLKDDFIATLLEEDPLIRNEKAHHILRMLAKTVVSFRPKELLRN